MANEVIINLTAVDMATAVFARVKASVEAFRGTMTSLTASVEASNNGALASIQATSSKIAAEVDKVKSRIASSSQSTVAKTSAFDDIEKANKRALASIEKLLDQSSVAMDRGNARMVESYKSASDMISAVVIDVNKKNAATRKQASSDEIAEIASSRERINAISANALDRAAQIERTGAERVAAIRRLAINSASNATSSSTSDKILETAAIKMDIITEQARKRSADAIQLGLRKEEAETQASTGRIATIRQNATNAVTSQVVAGNDKITASLRDTSAKVAADTAKTTAGVMRNIASISAGALTEIEKSNARITGIFGKDSAKLSTELEKKMASVTMTGSVDPVQIRANAAKDALEKEERLTKAYVAQQKALKDVDSAQQSATSSLGGFVARHLEIVGFYAALALIGRGFHLLIGDGIEFNRIMETTRMGMAALILSAHQFKAANGDVVTSQERVSASFKVAEDIQRRLLIASRNTIATYAELLEMMQVAMGPAIGAGITNMNVLTDIVIGASVAVKALGLNSAQLKQEVKAIFTGENRVSNLLNQALGITSGQIKALQGDSEALGRFYQQKFSAFMLVAANSTNIYAIAITRLKSVWSEMAGEFTKPLFGEIVKGMETARSAIAEMTTGASESGQSFAVIFGSLVPVFIELGRLVFSVTKAFVDFVSVFAPLNEHLANSLRFWSMIIDQFGALVLLVWSGSKAFFALSGAMDVASASTFLASTQTAILSGATFTLAGAMSLVLVHVGLVIASLYTLNNLFKLATASYEYFKERQAEKRTGMLDDATMETLDKWRIAFPEVATQVDKLKEKMILAKKVGPGMMSEARDEMIALARSINHVPKALEIMADTGAKTAAMLSEAFTKSRDSMRDLIDELNRSNRIAGLTGLKKDLQGAADSFEIGMKRIRDTFLIMDGKVAVFKGAEGSPERAEATAGFIAARSALTEKWLKDDERIRAEYADKDADKQKKKAEEIHDFIFRLSQENRLGSLGGIELEIQKIGNEYDGVVETIKKLNLKGNDLFRAMGLVAVGEARKVALAWEAVKQSFLDKIPGITELAGLKGESDVEKRVRAIQKAMDDLFEASKMPDAPMEKITEMESGLAHQLEMFQRYGDAWLIFEKRKKEWAAREIKENGKLDKPDKAIQTINTEFTKIWRSLEDGLTSAIMGALTGNMDAVKSAATKLAETILGAFVDSFIAPLQEKILGALDMQKDQKTGKIVSTDGSGKLTTGQQQVVDYAGYAAGGYGVGSMIGGGDAANQIGGAIGGLVTGAVFAAAAAATTSGIVLGIELGAFAGPVGMILGAIVGAIIGELFSPNTESHVTGSVNAEIRKQGSTIGKTLDTIYSSIVDVFVTGAPDKALELSKAYSSALADAFANTRFDIAAGSQEDIQKTWDWMMTSLLPKMALQAGFGQIGMGLPGGNRDALGGRAGFDWNTGGMDRDGRWIQNQLYDPAAPIPMMLLGLKFTANKIKSLAIELMNTDDPAAYLKKLEGLISVVVSMDNLTKRMSGGADSAFLEINKTPAQALEEQRKNLAIGFKNLALYAGEEQIAKAKEMIAASEQYYTANLQYIAQLQTLMQGMLDSIDKQIQGIEDSIKTPAQLQADARVRANAALTAVVSAQPADIQKLAQEAQDAIGVIVTGLMDLHGALQNVKDSFSEQIVKMQTWDRSFTVSMDDARVRANAYINAAGLGNSAEVAANGKAAVDAVNEIFEGLKSVISSAKSAMEAIGAQVEAMRTWDQSFTTSMDIAGKDFAAATEKLKGASKLTPEEITKFSNDAIEAAKTLFDGLKSIIAAGRSAMDAISKQIDDMKTWDQDFTTSMSAARSSFADNAKKLIDGTGKLSPEEIAKFSGDALEAAKKIFEGLKATIAAARSAMASIDSQVSSMLNWDQSFAQTLGAARLDFAAAVAKMTRANLSPEDIAKFSGDALDASKRIFDALRAIITAARSSIASVNAQIKDMGSWDRTPAESMSSAQADFSGAVAKLGGSRLTPEEITGFANDALDASKRVFEILKATITSARSAMASIASQVAAMGDWSKTFNTSLAESRKAFSTAETNLGTGKLTPEDISKFSGDAISAVQKIFEALKSIISAAKTALDSVNAQIDAMKTWSQTFTESLASAQSDFSAASKKLGAGNLSPEDITKFASDAMDASKRIFEALKAIISAAKAAIVNVNAQVKEMSTWDQGFSESMASARTTFADSMAGLNGKNLTPEEIAKFSGDALDSVKKIFEGLKAVIASAKAEITAIDSMIKGIKEYGRTTPEKMAAARTDVAAGQDFFSKVTKTTDPAEITKWGQATRDAIQVLIDGFRAIGDAAKQVKANIEALVTKMSDWGKTSEEVLASARSSALSQGALLRAELDKTTPDPTKIAELGAGAVDAVNKIFDALLAKINALKSAIESIDSLINGVAGRVSTAKGETPDQRLARLAGEFRLNAASVSSSSSTEDISRLTANAITAASDALGILIDRLAALKGLATEVGALVTKFISPGKDVLDGRADANGPINAYRRDAVAFQADVAAAMKLSGQAQIDAISKVKDAAVDLYARQKQMLEAIAASAEDMHASIQKQIWDINLGEMNPGDKANTVMDRINELRGQLKGATSVEAAKQITGEIQALVSQYLGMFDAKDPNRAGAVAWATQTLTDVEKIADEVYKRMWESIEASNLLIRQGLEVASGLVVDAMTKTEDEIDKWTTLLKQARESWNGVQKVIANEIKGWAKFLQDLQIPLTKTIDAVAAAILLLIPILESIKIPLQNAVSAASNDIAAFAAALPNIIPPLEATINAAAGGIAALVAALPGIANAFQAAINAASNDIGAYATALSGLSFPLQAEINAAAGSIKAFAEALPGINNALSAAVNAASNDIGAYAKALSGINFPLAAAINAAAGDIATFTNALPSLNNALQTSINWAAFQIAATANAMPTVIPALQAAVNAANAEIGKWAFELSQKMPFIVAAMGGVDAEINLWIAALVALRGAIETNLNTQIANTTAAFVLLIPEIDAARLMLSTLPEITTSAHDTSSALDGLTGAAGRLQDYLDGIGGGGRGNQTPTIINGGGDRGMSGNQVAAMLRDDPTLMMSQVGF